MMDLLTFMGGGEGRTFSADLQIGLGQGRVLFYRPNAGLDINLLDPESDVFTMPGLPYYIIFNDAAQPFEIRDFEDELIVELAGTSTAAEVVVMGIGVNSVGTREWRYWKYLTA